MCPRLNLRHLKLNPIAFLQAMNCLLHSVRRSMGSLNVFKINYNNKLYNVNEKSLEKALTCTTELFLNLYMKNIGLKL